MVKGAGLAAARARIESAFRALHGDCRDRSAVEADQTLREEIATEEGTTPAAATPVERSHEERTAARANAYAAAALRSPHVPRQVPHQGAWQIDVPSESAEELFKQALRDLGLETSK